MFTMAVLLSSPPAWAQDGAGTVAMAHVGNPVVSASLLGRISASTSPLAQETTARVTAEQSTTLASPADAPTDAQGRAYGEISRATLSRWTTNGRASLGMGVGAVGYSSAGSAVLLHPSPALTVGVRLAVADRTTMYADASSATGWPQPNYNARVGMEFKSAGAGRGLGFERGAIGMQLDSGYRLQMKPRRGGLALYLRGQF
jgi:hypothetical protein